MELFEKEHDYLLDLRFKKFPCVVLGVTEEYYRQSAKIFWPLRYALYASGSLFLKDNQLPSGISNRIELVNIFLHKAQSFNYAKCCDHISVLTLETIANHLKYGTICEEENQIFLPAANIFFENASMRDYFGIEIMSNDEWYTCCIPDSDIEAYHSILQRIQVKVHHYVDIELSANTCTSHYIAGCLNASLIDWMKAFTPKLVYSRFIITNRIDSDQEKRKCDRGSPCSLCDTKKIKCMYSHQKELSNRLHIFEERIKQLERNLIKPNYTNFETKRPLPAVLRITLTKELEKELFEKDHDYLLDLRFKKFPPVVFGMTEAFYRESAKIFWPLRFALYANGALFIDNSQLPKGVSDRIELAVIFLQKAQSFNFARKCDYTTVLTLETITSVCYQIQFSDCTILYYKLALLHARLSGINSEKGLAKITLFDYERENIRRLWWVLYRDYSSFPKFLVDSRIYDYENQLFLPSDRFFFESPTALDYYGIEIMTSSEWYTCCMPNLEIEAYHSILQRIQLKTSTYTDLELTANRFDNFYIAGCINSSLIEWRVSFLPISTRYFEVIKSRKDKDRDKAWFAVYIALLYYSVRINLVLPTFMRNVINGKNVTRQLYFKEAVDAAISCGQLIRLIRGFNPDLEYFEVVALLKLFTPTFFLLCCTKLDVSGAKTHYNELIDGVKQFSVAFQKLNQFHKILLHMESMDLLEAVIYYGIFIGRQKEELVERPAASQEELMENMNQMTLEQRVLPVVTQIEISPELNAELFDKEQEHLLKLRFQRFPSIVFGIAESYYRQSANLFWPLKYALYAGGALFLKDDQIPAGISNRIELANIFLNKAQSFDFVRKSDHLTVLALETIANVCYQLNSIEESKLYFRLALQIARTIQINNEEEISKITIFDYERENIRRIWWLLYRDYSTCLSLISYGEMGDSENQLSLPSNSFYFDSGDSQKYFGVEIMTSNEYFTVCPPDLEIVSYYSILHRIQSKMYHHYESQLSDNQMELLYIAGSINASLNEYFEVFAPKINQARLRIQSNSSSGVDTAWFTLFITLCYCNIRINLILPTMMKNIVSGKNAVHQLYFKEALNSAKLCAGLVQLVINYNPNLDYFPILSLQMLFPVTFFILCCEKLLVPDIRKVYNLLVFGLKIFSETLQKRSHMYNILLEMKSKSILECVIYYSIYIRRQTADLTEQAAPNHIAMFSMMSLADK
ncbi:hypothetical protein HDV06_002066 [Boothiomyces sp. JEL0866]|nr:hypothetical protein HDV06_002066 [Boothiomyces sp. JEL0866]